MDNDSLLEQFQELYDKYLELHNEQKARSSLKVATEAKRFAKSHRLLIPYIHACFSITNCAQHLFEAEIGIDNAMEIIALVESEDKARKFQDDFDRDHYAYTVHWVSACAYDNLAVHTARRNGYNSPVVHGAVDDGIHVCRRTGKLECVECFREYAVRICLSSGDYEMGEHYARLCATSTARENADDRRYVGYKDLIRIYMMLGRFQASLEALEAVFPYAETYHDPLGARIEVCQLAERLFELTGRSEDLSGFLAGHGLPDGKPELPESGENAEIDLAESINEAVRLTCRGNPLEASRVLEKTERFLLGQENLNDWFDIRVQRIAALSLAEENGEASDVDVERLAEELRSRASKACQWSAIRALDAMLRKTIRLNPLGIAFPIDLGPYATPGTSKSGAQLQLVLPLVEKPTESPGEALAPDERVKSPLELEAEAWYAALDVLWNDAARHDFEQSRTDNPVPFPGTKLLETTEREILNKIMRYAPETQGDVEGRTVDMEEFLALARPLSRMLILRVAENMKSAWDWTSVFAQKFSDQGRVLSARAHLASVFGGFCESMQITPESLGVPSGEALQQLAAQAFELEPNRTGVATIAGMIFRSGGNNRESQRYFTRAVQVDRRNEFATISLAELYEEADRPKDAMAAIDLYTRAGGRHPGMLWKAMEIAFQNEMPQQFLLYYDAYVEAESTFPMLRGQRIWALALCRRFGDVLQELNVLDEELGVPGKDRLFLRALCRAKLDDADWTETFDAALRWEGDQAEGLIGSAFDPCGPLWEYIARWSETDSRRQTFENFLYRRGLVPADLLIPDEEESDAEKDEDDQNLYGYYRCFFKQPLNPQIPAYAGWIQIPDSDSAYIAPWFVLAESEEQAMEFALESQSRCYPIPPEPLGCEQVDSYYARRPQTAFQGRRFRPNDEQ